MGEFVVILFIALTIVTLVGHGIWVLLAAFFRALGGASSAASEPRVRCPYCGYSNPPSLERCPWCNKLLRGDVASEVSDLASLRRQLGWLRDRGVVEPEVVDNLLARIYQYEERLMHPPAVPQPAAAEPQSGRAEPRPAEEPRLEQPAVSSPLAAPVLVAEVVEEPPAEPAVPPAGPQPAAAGLQPAAAAWSAPEPQPPAPPPPPRKSWMEVVAEFFEERNVRLAEVILVLVGGLLIVGGSVAVVISFWEEMESYLKFAVFVGISSAVFGLGLLAYHRWKLEISGRGLLLIATLLVPLNFLAMASLSKEDWTLLTLATELTSLAIFVYLVGLASQVLVPGRVWHLVLAVAGNSAAVLLVARLTGEGAHGWPIGAVGGLPVGILGLAVGGYLFPLRREETILARRADGIFCLTGTAGFALAIALGLLVSKGAQTDGLAVTLRHLAPLLTLAAIPFLSAGLTVARRIGGEASLGAYSTAGTALALVAVAVMFGALAMAWPRPLGVMAVGTFDAAALAYVALRHRLPAAHAGAIVCAAIVYLIAFHLAAGNLDWRASEDQGRQMLQLALGARSGTALVGLFAALALIGEWLARRGLRPHAVQYVGGSAAVALASLLLVTAHNQFTGGASALDAMLVYGIYGTCSLAMAARWQRQWFSYLGFGLLAGTTAWALWWQTGHLQPVWGAVLAAEGLAMGLVAAALNRPAGRPPRLRWDAQVGQAFQPDSNVAPALQPDTAPPDVRLESLTYAPTRWIQLIEVYRLPLLHVAEVVALAAAALAVWTFECQRTPAPVAAAVCLAALFGLTAWGYRSRERTWVASGIVLAGLIHTLVVNYADWVERPWVVALLTHATLAALASTLLILWMRRRAGKGDRCLLPERPATNLRSVPGSAQKAPVPFSGLGQAGTIGDLCDVFIEPLMATSLISSTVALPMILAAPGIDALLLAEYLYWLAAIWLAIACSEVRPGWFTAAQGVLTLATLSATTAWLERHPWDAIAGPKAPIRLDDPRTLQAYGIGLALLTLAWAAVRILFRRSAEARRLLEPGWPAVDRVIGHAVVAAQLLLAAGHVAIVCARELIGPDAVGTWQLVAFGPAAWLLVGGLALMLLAALWHGWRDAEALSALMVAATLPYLAAGQCVADRATATAASWALASGFVVLGAMIWMRRWLLAACLRIGAKVDLGRHCLAGCQATVLAAAAAPALILTTLGALLRIHGISPPEPTTASLFGGLDPNVAYLVPQVLVVVGLVGFAVRERSAGYAFCGGLVVQIAVVLGYLVRLTLRGQLLDTAAAATSLQLATIATAVWAMVWLATRRWVHAWREGSQEDAPQLLMDVQIGMSVLGNAILIGPALVTLALYPATSHTWAIHAGSPWGWAALVLAAAAGAYREVQRGRRWQPETAGLLGMIAVGLLACTVRGLFPDGPEWGYRTLMLGWAAYAVVVAAASWLLGTLRTPSHADFRAGPCRPGGTPETEDRGRQAGPTRPGSEVAAYLRISHGAAFATAMSGVLAVLLGLKAAFFHAPWEELPWASAAIALAAAAWATMAVWRRAEGWAFAAAQAVNLAVSLVVWYGEWHYFGHVALEDWWVHLLQANAIASAAAAMVWLVIRRRLYGPGELTIPTSPLLAAQTALGAIATAGFLVPALARLVSMPARLPEWTGQAAGPAGWAVLVLVAFSAAWYLLCCRPRAFMHVVAGAALGIGTLAACSSTHWGLPAPRSNWLEYHVLESAWALAGLAVLAIGMFGRTTRVHRVFPRRLVQLWVTCIGAAVLGLALLHTEGDPAAPWWSVGAIFAVSLSAGVLALWLRLPGYVYLSGLAINVAGTVMWWTWGPWNPYALVEFNVVCLAIASGVWSMIGLLYRPGVPPLEIGGRREPFAHAAAELAAVLVASIAAVLVIHNIQAMPHPAIDHLGWLALAAAAAAIGICLWDRSAAFVLPGLYALGVSAIGFSWDMRRLASRELAWTAACELAAFALVAALAGLLFPRMQRIWRAMRIPVDRKTPIAGWFSAVQAAVAAVAAVLAAWVSLDLRFDAMAYPGLGWPSGRMAGLAAAALLLPAAIVMAAASGSRWRSAWQYAALGLGVLALSTPGWALLRPEWGDLGMHRSVVLMVAAVVVALVSGFGLERVVPVGSDWIASGRRAFPVLAGLALAVLAATVGQEFYHYVPYKGAPMALPAVIVVAVALAGLVVGCLACALVPRLDPFGWSDRRRTFYVYAAEAIVLVICVHLRLTRPDLFHLEIIAKYWMLLIMAAAFGGAGLSELFHRRGLPVLSEPLERTAILLPLAPAIGFWFVPELQSHERWLLAGRSPAVWFLAAIFYGFLAATRRGTWQTAVFTLLSLAAANVGISVAWYQLDIEFFWAHPQVWLIPIGLSILLAEHTNRERLSAAQSAGIRYLALSVIYIPSSAEYLQEIGKSVWLPLVLILLSLSGVLAGVVLRIRSFLYLGVTFLGLVIATMVRYAAYDLEKTWVLYLCCIFLGTAVIALVAFYEKRRDAILAAIRQFRQWEK